MSDIDWGNPTLYIAIVVVGGAIWGIVKLILKIGGWLERNKVLQSNFDTLVDKVDTLVDKVDTLVDKVDTFMEEVRADFKDILRRLPGTVVEGNSPLRLSQVGQSISEELDAGGWANQHAQEIANTFKGRPPYEIQAYCMNFVQQESNLSDGLIEKMRSCAYEKGLPLSQIEDVLAIELRDAVLKVLPD